MKILFCSPCPVDPKLGAAQALLELAAALERVGAEARVVGPADVGAPDNGPAYAPALHAYLRREAAGYDVVDFDYKHLRYARADFPADVLMVARAQLLLHHYVESPLPPLAWRPSALVRVLRYEKDRFVKRRRRPQLDEAFRRADLCVVLNRHARETLAGRGVDPARIVVQPNAMSAARQDAFTSADVAPPPRPVVSFIGMFGPRKGSEDLPEIVRRVAAACPDVVFRLMGTRGLYRTEAEVRAHFPEALQRHLEVIPEYAPEDLPDLLAGCSAGVFPSYAEGFPLGVIEMLAAALPVVAYDAPGAPEMVPPADLVPTRDRAAMSARLVALLGDDARLRTARAAARRRALDFEWTAIARDLAAAYDAALTRVRPVAQGGL